ncbi:Piso0_002677 [Millerozyma farinosa CBS 7064]|uniref:Piso0_002677 protein n=1 Tax=Pichia sorbitophila (strain ATCC MYA-4447 / BCRC 22081 / CBS 7064 / NBRC 10061 / NRRL Y-12695) TaxID=559304 RepID=G8YFN9_PICSO|nr:Piso0_002677 [Millerozyma farinosa CBS 7064]
MSEIDINNEKTSEKNVYDDPRTAYILLGEYVSDLNRRLNEYQTACDEQTSINKTLKTENEQLKVKLKQSESKVIDLCKEVYEIRKSKYAAEYNE